jgi:hypothetical protein
MMRWFYSISVLGFALVCAPGTARTAEPCKTAPTRLTVVVVLATEKNKTVDPKLTALATEVRKLHDELTGFRVESVLQKSLAPGESHTFELLDKQKLIVKVDKPKDKEGKVGLTVTPPGLDEVSYTCTCDKFFPLVTPHKTKAGEQLILAILAKPCDGKGP